MSSLTGQKRRSPDDSSSKKAIATEKPKIKESAAPRDPHLAAKPAAAGDASKPSKAAGGKARSAVGGAGAPLDKKARRTVIDDDIDALFSGLSSAKVKAAESAAADEAKAAAKAKKAAKAEAAEKAVLEELERKGRSSNRIKGADSPVAVR